MYNPNDVLKVSEEDWEEFKKDACEGELFYRGEGALLDTAEGRSKFCRLNETSVFRKDAPDLPGSKIWVFNNQGKGMPINTRSRVDPAITEDIVYDSDGYQISKSYEPA